MTFRRPNPVFGSEYENLRRILLKARREARISQRTLAERIGKSHSHICMIERGQRRIDILEFCAIATSLGASPLKLLGDVWACLHPASSEPERPSDDCPADRVGPGDHSVIAPPV
ncbi:helix-turn-helix domain-containing protein [Phenylobacterium aquaticum]|uniref:helix-turn-helix domain-containing protein n=1 Tax=Phenylobacterium aquaticum TaxID=1763816 RepID=UPI003AFAADDA